MMNRSRSFYLLLVLLALSPLYPSSGSSSEIYMNPVVVDTNGYFSILVTAKNVENLKSFVIHLHMPIEAVAKVTAIEPGHEGMSVFSPDSYYDPLLKSVVYNVTATFDRPVSGNAVLFKVDAQASGKAAFSQIGISIREGELIGSFLHGGSIYVLDQNWPWYDLHINYRNAFHRLDFDNSGRVDKKDLFFLSAAWHQSYHTDIPITPLPTPDIHDPTPTPIPHSPLTIQEILGTWTFDFLHYTLIGTNIHRVFDATITEDGVVILLDRYQTEFLGTFSYEETNGKFEGVIMIRDANPLNPTEEIDYFINFEGESGAGKTLSGDAKFTYNNKDILITGYESYGLTLTDKGIFTAVKK